MEREVATQRTDKLRNLARALEAEGLSLPLPARVVGGTDLGYRNRLRLRVDDRGRAMFFNPKKATSCAVLDPALAAAVAWLEGAGPLRGLRAIEHLELRVGDDRAVGLCAYAATPPGEGTRSALRSELPSDWRLGFAADERLEQLEYYLEEELGQGLRYHVPLSSFVQVNSSVCRALVASVRQLAATARVESFNDLFCGSGNFTLPLLADGLEGASYEVDPLAVAALSEGAQRWTRGGRRHTAEVADARTVAERLSPRDLLLANPPRAGLKLSAETARLLASRATRCLALCSCNPRSLARDLALLLPWGFEVRELRAFDMFPHTEHLETLAWLERPGSAARGH